MDGLWNYYVMGWRGFLQPISEESFVHNINDAIQQQ